MKDLATTKDASRCVNKMRHLQSDGVGVPVDAVAGLAMRLHHLRAE
jgi:hypothetical protein